VAAAITTNTARKQPNVNGCRRKAAGRVNWRRVESNKNIRKRTAAVSANANPFASEKPTFASATISASYHAPSRRSYNPRATNRSSTPAKVARRCAIKQQRRDHLIRRHESFERAEDDDVEDPKSRRDPA
jgi:hypothetical protein